MAKKKTSPEQLALPLIKKWEGFMPEPYKCPAQIPTIGYGSTRYENGDRVAMEDCKIDRNRGEEILLHHVKEVAQQVRLVITTKLTPNQMAAIISFTYNLGIGNLMRSTLIDKVNRMPENQTIPDEFRRWNKCKGSVLAGLTARREEEAEMYIG